MIEIVTITRSNRAYDLLDWVNYHIAIGFDKITIYDNESEFSVTDLFKNNKNIEVKEMHSNKISPIWENVHPGLFTEICEEKRGKAEWVAFFDTDEYLFLKNSNNIKSILPEDKKILGIFWKFMSSNKYMEDRNLPHIDCFRYARARDPRQYSQNIHMKTIVNLSKMKEKLWWKTPHQPAKPHMDIYTPDGEYIPFEHVPETEDFYIGKTVLLYHYFHQTYKDWLFKIANRKDLTQEHFLLSSYNYTIEDFSMINKKKELGI